MKAQTLISIQLTSLIIMAGCGPMIFKSIIATILFVSAFLIFIRCSIYIEKNCKHLLREYNHENNQIASNSGWGVTKK